MFSFINPILNVDSYKSSHYLQYPPGTERVSSYIEARGVDVNGPLPADADIVFMGLQPFCLDYLSTPVSKGDLENAAAFFARHGEPFNREGWQYIIDNHGGYLPIEISAVEEGTLMTPSNVMLQVQNTDTAVPWVTSYIETALLRAIWYPTTVATLSREAKKIIWAALKKTCDDPLAEIDFKLHDFGARGVSSMESAALGGCAHLVNFMGSDTVSGVIGAHEWYHADMAGFSIPAAEHSTITSWGPNHESDAYRNMIAKFGGAGKIFAVVSDSWNIDNAVRRIWGDELRSIVMTNGGRLVVRPDSGDPARVVLDVVQALNNAFIGHTTINQKGFKVLPKYLRVIQGDGVDLGSIYKILMTLEASGFSAENVAFGMGGALLQKLDRDTLKFAMKCSAVQVKGEWRDVYKSPIGDPTKASKRGRLALRRSNVGLWETIGINDCAEYENRLRPVWRNGKHLITQDFDDVRHRARLR